MRTRTSLLLAAAFATLPVVALAHTGQGDHTFFDGFSHPFLGADHLLAMLVVGIWSMLNARRVWLAPLCFVSSLAVGAVVGQNGFTLPHLEPLVSASVLVLGAMLTLPFKPGLTAALALIGGFAFLHGLAHGGELSSGGEILAGIVAGSALLHGCGMGYAHFLLKQRPLLTRRIGQAVALVGGGLIVSTVL